MSIKPSFYLILAFIMLSAFQCPRKMQKIMLSKIKFNYSKIDDNGLRNGEVAVDYEFCIPANESIVQEVLSIAPAIRVMKNSKGRIECTKQQWLVINSTHSPEWKKQLYAIAYLDYVENIIETFYE
jgi:hypothetical protein